MLEFRKSCRHCIFAVFYCRHENNKCRWRYTNDKYNDKAKLFNLRALLHFLFFILHPVKWEYFAELYLPRNLYLLQ